ncbi:MAG: hypothetical protein J0L92_16355 [Deltaproteobacteria bacterium]|nr:hypothetical protein [Deltaproteobacteria bacterium]
MRGSESLWIGVGVGCSLLVLCGLCIVGAGSVFWLRSTREEPPPPVVGPAPTTWPTPTPTPPPTTPPIVGPATTVGSGGGTDPRHVRATVTEVTGLADVAVGASCTAEVTRRDLEDGTFWCNAQITCGGRSVYGGPEAGFFHCVLYEGTRRDVVGSDSDTTEADQDPAMSLNTVGGTLEIHDDATGRNGAMRILAQVDAID